MLVVVRVYKSTGHFQPDFPAMMEVSHCRAPWYSEIWLGWEETPWRSKVIRVSIVAVGSLELAAVLLAVGENADERSCAMLAVDQVKVMLS